MIAVLEEMRAEIELSNIRTRLKRERIEEIDRRIERMRDLNRQEQELLGKVRRNAS